MISYRCNCPISKIALILLLLVVSASCQGTKEPDVSPLALSVLELKEQDIPIYQTFVGQTYGAKDIDIRARVDGVLEGIFFKEGALVEQGTLLYTIDKQPLLARQAARMGDLAQAKTQLAKSESDLNRIKPLAATNAVSKRDLDAAVAQYDAAKAGVEAAEANLRASQIELGYASINAPITGIIGITKAKVGDYVGREPNPVILNTVSDTNIIEVRFFLSENEFLQLSRRRADKMFNELAAADGISLILSDDTVFTHKGKFDFLDRSIDSTTGSILVQTSFPNPEHILRPGLFARIKFMYDYVGGGLLVPKRAVRELQTMYQIYVINNDNQAELRTIEVSHTVDQQYVVKSGLKAGDRIVVEGLEKIRPGMVIDPIPFKNKQLTTN